MKFQGFIGPTYESKSKNANCERCINYYPEVVEVPHGKNQIYYRQTAGLELQFTVGIGPIRLIWQENMSRAEDSIIGVPIFFVVSGSEVYRCYYSSGSFTTTLMGTIGTSTGPVSAASIKVQDANGWIYQTVFVDGDNNYLYQSFSYKTDETFESFTDAGYTPITEATQIKWLDGFLIIITKNSNVFNVSEYDGLTFNALDFATAEGNPDNILGIEVLNRDLWLFNERSIEVYVNTGNPQFPFERVQGGFSEKGVLSGFSVAKADSTLFWLGRDEKGQGIVYAAKGIVPQRISNHAVESKISTYLNNQNARGYAYQADGHTFYVLSFDEATWVYDLSSGMWHEKAALVNGELMRHRGESYSFYSAQGLQLCGDYVNGNVYALKESVYSDNGEPIPRIRIAPHLYDGKKNVIHKSFELDMEVGLADQGDDPQMMMQFSDDGGYTWSNEKWVSIGQVGKYKRRVRWQRLGIARDRVYKTMFTHDCSARLIGAEIEVEGTGS